MSENLLGKQVEIITSQNLYKWAKVWGKIQKNYYTEPVYLRREKQIKDFILLNEFKNVYIEKDTDILKNIKPALTPSDADLVVIADQKFSRMPCIGIIERIQNLLQQCPRLYLCLNRHYINIDDTYCDSTLDQHYPLAITQWLKKSLDVTQVVDLSLDYLDCGDYFTWVVPDRMYYITR